MTQSEDLPISELEPPEEFFSLEAMVSEHDTDADAPLRRGAQPFSWQTVESMARGLLDHYHDIRVAIWLMRAAMMQRAVTGLAEGLQAVTRVLQGLAIDTLSQESREDLALQLSWLAGNGFRAQVERLPTSLPAPLETLGDLKKFSEAEGAGIDLSDLHAALSDAAAALASIEQFCTALDVLPPADFGPLLSAVQQASLSTTPSDAGHQVDPGHSSANIQEIRSGPISTVNSRDDARNLIDLLIEYFNTHEPGHPAPIFLSRVRKMIGADFETLMNELFLDGQKLIQLINTPRPS